MAATLPLATFEYEEPTLALANWARTMKRSVLREMLAVVSQPGILSFAGGLPAPELFPTREYAEAVRQVLTTDPRALQYGPPFAPLKSHIVHLMARRGARCTEEEVFVTTGAQQALSVISGLLLNQRSEIIAEELVYTGFQQAIAPYEPEILAVSTDLESGINVDEVEAHLLRGARPSFLYVIPEAHNPLGVGISLARRRHLVQLAREFGVPIVEDDPYGFLWYESGSTAPMRELDDRWVFYVGSFSKILAPALRLGWMVVPRALIPKLQVVKESHDLETSALIQRAVSAYLDAGHLPAHLRRLRSEYRHRRDTMLDALTDHFPAGARWTKPSAGMFIWVELPDHMNAAELLGTAVEEAQVAYIPGSAFSTGAGKLGARAWRSAENCMRLNFSNSTPAQIEEGIARLGQILRRHC